MIRMIKYMIFNYELEDTIDDNEHLSKMLNSIYSKFQERGIKCSKIKSKAFFNYFICSISDINVSVGMFAAIHSDKKLSSIACNIARNWRYLFKRLPSEPQKEEALNTVVNIVTEIAKADSSYLNTRWMEMDEWKTAFLGIQAK